MPALFTALVPALSVPPRALQSTAADPPNAPEQVRIVPLLNGFRGLRDGYRAHMGKRSVTRPVVEARECRMTKHMGMCGLLAPAFSTSLATRPRRCQAFIALPRRSFPLLVAKLPFRLPMLTVQNNG